MREYGGYMEFEHFHGQEYHAGAYRFNTARHALRYILRERGITEIYLPDYLCPVIAEACVQEEVHVKYYHVGLDFYSMDIKIPKGAWFYFINYYGQFTNEEIHSLHTQNPNMIVDNVQAFFQKPVEGIDTIYTCRKFFGVPDGAYLYTKIPLDRYAALPQDDSMHRLAYLAGRIEHGASAWYADFKRISEKFQDEPVRRMSKFTENILKGIDYKRVMGQRTKNFQVLHEHFVRYNRLSLKCVVGGYMYPLYVHDGDVLRKKLVEEKIYVPLLWPVTGQDKKDEAYHMSHNILPLPIDQRYVAGDMEYIAGRVKRCIA